MNRTARRVLPALALLAPCAGLHPPLVAPARAAEAATAAPVARAADATAGDPRVAVVRAFRALRDAGADEAAARLLAGDPRVWYETRAAEGEPWTLDGGSWATWDREFRSHSTELSCTRDADTVDVVVEENNDFYRLTERSPGRTRLSYFVGPDLRIAGLLVRGLPRDPATRVRFEKFKAWAAENEPDELAALLPEGRIDPARPERWRALLERWRAAAHLPPVAPAAPEPAGR